MTKQRILRYGLPVLGALLGFLYWYKVGCLGGACPIWSNAYISTLYGGVIGFLLGGVAAPKQKREADTPAETGGPKA